MARGQARQRVTEARVIEIDTRRVLAREEHHFAVIDIGSNSIRLVVYDDLSRAPFPRFNEKSFCALGAGLDETGRLAASAIDMAVRAVRRFESIARAMRVETVHVLATEATRRASNGADLVDAIRAATGLETRVLSGQEEATYAALGVISGFFQPKGLAGDMGGGSLEVAEVARRPGGRADGQHAARRPAGEGDAGGGRRRREEGDRRRARRLAAAAADRSGVLRDRRRLAGAGARAHRASGRPISVVNGYDVAAEEVRGARKEDRPDGAGGGRGAPRRAEPAHRHAAGRGRGDLAGCCSKLKPERVVFSVFGLREGWLYAQLDAEEQYRDPLLEGAMAIGLPAARVPEFSAALARWTDELFPGETQGDRRLRLAACALTDMAWRDHEKVRAIESFRRLLQFPFVGISHPERAFLAVGDHGPLRRQRRRDGAGDDPGPAQPEPAPARRRSSAGCCWSATASRPACRRCSSRRGMRIDADGVRLEMLNAERVPDSDAVQARCGSSPGSAASRGPRCCRSAVERPRRSREGRAARYSRQASATQGAGRR